MMYSSAIYAEPGHAPARGAAGPARHHLPSAWICSPDDHLVEIGTGWGGLAIHAASHYGCRVTTTTISA